MVGKFTDKREALFIIAFAVPLVVDELHIE